MIRIPEIHPRKKSPIIQTSNNRKVLAVAQAYAQARKTVVITYKKRTSSDSGPAGTIIVRELEPYSIRFRRTQRGGRAKFLFGYCYTHRGIHMFYVNRILHIQGTNRRYVPRWSVESLK